MINDEARALLVRDDFFLVLLDLIRSLAGHADGMEGWETQGHNSLCIRAGGEIETIVNKKFE